MEKRVNYQKILQNELKKIEISGKKPTLLLHVCCGPCFLGAIPSLENHFDITILYNNSNIYPESEYLRRRDELFNYIQKVYPSYKIIEIPYDNTTYNKDLEQFKDEPEGQNRCRLCFRKRISLCAELADQGNYDYFSTVMSISRYKNSQDLNKIGEDLAKNLKHAKWLYADFKKNGGYEKSLVKIKECKMYFQQYCGCQFSYEKYIEKLKK